MNQQSSSLSSTELVSKLNEGGWVVCAGRETGNPRSFTQYPVVKASLLEAMLLIETGNRSFVVPSDNIALVYPWDIVIRREYLRREQVKKSEGGGWCEVPFMGTALRLSHLELARKAVEEEQERVREREKAREEEARRQKAEKERREAEELNARREQFVAGINTEFAGKKLVKIEVTDESKLRLQFEDDSTIEIDSEICDCYYGGGSAVVNGTSLQGFNRTEYV